MGASPARCEEVVVVVAISTMAEHAQNEYMKIYMPMLLEMSVHSVKQIEKVKYITCDMSKLVH